ncbi:MAG: hypothetical protein H0U65_14705 [Rubrobacter sp.]|nr:hypothetical protein [Rubrobacter sp.]
MRPKEKARERTVDSESPEVNTPDYVDAREAAEMLGMSQRRVRKLAAQGALETKREDGASRMVFSLSSVRRLGSERSR